MSETVLVVDDHPLVLTTLACTLVHAGYRVLQAASGEEALTLASQSGETIHLLVCDLILPGIPGTELARKLAALHPQVRCLFITGLPHHPRVTAEVTAALLPKPFLPHVLIRRARELLSPHLRVMPATRAS